MRLKDANSMTDDEISEVLDFADTISGWVKSVRWEGFKRANQRTGAIKGWKLAKSQASYEFHSPESVPQVVSTLGLTRADIYDEVLISPAKLKAKLKAKYKGRGHKEIWDKYEALVHNVGGASTTLVRDSDIRDEVKRGHEFKEIAEKSAKLANSDDIEDLI